MHRITTDSEPLPVATAIDSAVDGTARTLRELKRVLGRGRGLLCDLKLGRSSDLL
jgi:hypothetical protein